MKKIARFVLGILFIFPLLCSARVGWEGNWLLGASLGFADREASRETTLTYVSNFGFLNFPVSDIVRDHADKGIIQGIFGGYQAICNRWLMGIEMGIEWHHFDKNQAFAFSDAGGLFGWLGNARYRRNGMIDLSGRIGFAVTPVFMPYVRLGAEFGQDRFEAQYALAPAFATPILVESTQKHWTHRFLAGVGVEIPIPRTCGATLRLEYDFHSKARTIELQGDTIVELSSRRRALARGVPTAEFITGMQPYTQSGRISLVWNFF